MTGVISIHNFETFTFPQTITLYATKRLELYTIVIALSIQIHVDSCHFNSIHNFETFTFPPTITLYATKRQELYIVLALSIQIHVDSCITPELGRMLCFICISGSLCVLCPPHFFVTMYKTFHSISPSPCPRYVGK